MIKLLSPQYLLHGQCPISGPGSLCSLLGRRCLANVTFMHVCLPFTVSLGLPSTGRLWKVINQRRMGLLGRGNVRLLCTCSGASGLPLHNTLH